VCQDFYVIFWHLKSKPPSVAVVKLLNQRWWIPDFPRNSNMTGDMYTCVSVTGNFTRAYAYYFIFKVPYHKSAKQKKMAQCPGAHATARWSLPAVYLIYSSSVEHWHGSTRRSKSRAWHWWIQTEKCWICILRWWIPNYRWRLKAEVKELGSGGIPTNIAPDQL